MNGVNSLLTVHTENVEQMTPVGSGTHPHLSQDSLFSYLAIVNVLPSSVHQPGLDLANRNILWTAVTSSGIKIPLPLGSWCSISLVSKKHADLVSQNCPDLKFIKLARPLSVSVASAESQLQAVGMMHADSYHVGKGSSFYIFNVSRSRLNLANSFWPEPLEGNQSRH